MAVDGVDGHGLADLVHIAAVADDRDLTQRIDVARRELPGDHLGDAVERGLGGCRAVEGTEHGDADRAGVETFRVATHHRAIGTPGACFPDGAEAVDDEVVADVVEFLNVLVEGLDRTQKCGH